MLNTFVGMCFGRPDGGRHLVRIRACRSRLRPTLGRPSPARAPVGDNRAAGAARARTARPHDCLCARARPPLAPRAVPASRARAHARMPATGCMKSEGPLLTASLVPLKSPIFSRTPDHSLGGRWEGGRGRMGGRGRGRRGMLVVVVSVDRGGLGGGRGDKRALAAGCVRRLLAG